MSRYFLNYFILIFITFFISAYDYVPEPVFSDAPKPKNSIEDILYVNETIENVFTELTSKKFVKSLNKKLSQSEIIDTDLLAMQKEYGQFLKNKNNMANNYQKCLQLETFASQYKEIITKNLKIFKVLYDDKYFNYFKTYDEFLSYGKENIKNFDNYYKLLNKANSYRNNYIIWSTNIRKYSKNYEKLKNKNDKLANCKTAIDLELMHDGTFKQNYVYPLYGYGLVFFKVIQSMPNGILVKVDYRTYTFESKTIFITTKKQFADDQIIRQQMYLGFSGYYNYMTVLGSNRKIYKFREINPKINQYYFLN